MRYSISNIANIITEDPDILSEVDSSIDSSMDSNDVSVPTTPAVDKSVNAQEAPLTSMDVEKQAKEIAGEDPPMQVKDQLKAEDEAKRAQEAERRKMIEPQMQELQNSMDTLGTGITQGVDAANQGGEAFKGLDGNMSAIRAILQNLEKQIY